MNAHTTSDAFLDEGLLMLAGNGPTLANRLTNHAPMVIEAMSAMGCGDRIEAWIDSYRDQLRPWPPTGEEIAPDGWRAALGRPSLVSAWRRHFERELEATPWTELVRLWTPRLAPGVVSAALHGLIRVGHAVRSLSRRETEPRLAELAAALASWAYAYQELPAGPGAVGRLTPSEALARIPFVPEGERRNEGAITTALTVLEGRRWFVGAADLPAITGDLPSVNRAFGELFAEVFIANARSPLTAIVFTHGVTGFAAVDALLPVLPRQAGAGLIRRVWQAGAGLYACYGAASPGSNRDACAAPIDLANEAVAHGDDHVIKLTEACLRLVSAGAPERMLQAPRLAMELLPRHAV